MARTNLQVITDALKLAGIVNQIETPSNEDAQDALLRLNDMMLGWKRQKGIELGFYPQTSLAANIPIDDEYFEVVTLQLSKRISQHWGVGLSSDVLTEASAQWDGLLAQFIAPEPADMSHLPGTRRGSYSIDSDV